MLVTIPLIAILAILVADWDNKHPAPTYIITLHDGGTPRTWRCSILRYTGSRFEFTDMATGKDIVVTGNVVVEKE